MIPKIIHYCWFGGNPKNELLIKCFDSWKKYCPNYIIKEWNETNFDVNECQYVKEAYETQKWAFISDYVRLYALYTEGGIYVDADLEIIKPIDKFMELRAFSGFETMNSVPTGIMAAEPGLPLIKELLAQYDHLHFIQKDGTLDVTPNIVRITKTMVKHGLIMNNEKQTIQDFTMFPKDYFCPKSPSTGLIQITPNTYTIHHFSGSWVHPTLMKIKKIKTFFIRKFGIERGKKIAFFLTLPYKASYGIENRGIYGFIKHVILKIFS